MGKKRTVYSNWLVEIGCTPELISIDKLSKNYPNQDSDLITKNQTEAQKVRHAVQNALKALTVDEKELIIRLYYMGRTYREISEKSGKTISMLEAIKTRAFKKLKKELTQFVSEQYGLKPEFETNCIICNSEHCHLINQIIVNRDKKEIWKPVIDQIMNKFEIKIRSPQLLIGHEKYHAKFHL